MAQGPGPLRSVRLWEVIDLLGSRCPHLTWHPERVKAVLEDFPMVDPVPVAGRAADWLAFEATRAKDGPQALRTFFEKASREQLLVRDTRRRAMDRDLSVYDQFLN